MKKHISLLLPGERNVLERGLGLGPGLGVVMGFCGASLCESPPGLRWLRCGRAVST